MGRPKGCAKTGGRVAGKSLDKGERIKITSAMAGSIMAVFERLGGEDFLYRWAKENQTAYVTNCLARLMPPMPKEGDDTGAVNNTQNNYYGNLTPLEAAQRVAFALSVGARELDKQAVTIEHAPEPVSDEPVFDPKAWVPPTDAPDMPDPGQRDDPLFASKRERDREHWAEEVHLTPEERADRALVRETQEADITNYRGSASEQPGGSVPRPPDRKLSAGERCRVISSRRNRNDLL